MDKSHRLLWAASLLLLGLPNADCLGQGISLNGMGPINRAMGGAATAAPLDALGQLYWNPAGIAVLPSSEVSVGLELALPHQELASRLPANAFGQGVPAMTSEGSTVGEPGVVALPSVGIVTMPEDSALTFGLGIMTVAGFLANYPASETNPILSNQPPLGLGRISSRAEFLQLAPTVAVRVTDRLAIGAAPTINMARVAAEPLLLAAPNADGTFPSGTGTRYHWGGGFQIGVFYDTQACWKFGATVKSRQWFEKFRFHSEDAAGNPRVASFEADYPWIVSLGVSYEPSAGTLIAADFRYLITRTPPPSERSVSRPMEPWRGWAGTTLARYHWAFSGR